MDFIRLSKVKHYIDYNTRIVNLFVPLFGGFSGGTEGNAISSVASIISGTMVEQANLHNGTPTNPSYILHNSSRNMIWAACVLTQAITRNSNAINFVVPVTQAGSCTEMSLYEIAAYTVATSACGAHFSMTIEAGSKFVDMCTGLNARFGAEVAHAAASLTRGDANELVKSILKKYEENLNKPELVPKGKLFNECYDLQTVKPTNEYLKIYNKVKKELENIGLKFK
jgi:methylamine--corrinoid protein Co-methyltransferase